MNFCGVNDFCGENNEMEIIWRIMNFKFPAKRKLCQKEIFDEDFKKSSFKISNIRYINSKNDNFCETCVGVIGVNRSLHGFWGI